MSALSGLSIGFVGGGNMATAIGEGILNKGLCKPSKMWVSGPHIKNLSHWEKLGVNTTEKNGEVVTNCDVIFLSVKPHLLDTAIENCFTMMTPGNSSSFSDKLFISILAGTSIETLTKKLSRFERARIIRTMPNTPMLLGVGATVYAPGPSALESDNTIVEAILGSTGIFEQVPESMINAIGGLSGSGPAFVYLMIEALSDGGVKQGIPRAMATKFAAQTVLGAAKMVLETGKHPGQLKDEVCSPGGSTICGIHELEKAGTRASLIRAIEAAVEKSTAMGKQNNS